MIHFRRAPLAAAFACAAVFNSPAAAIELIFVPSIGYQTKQLSFDQTYSGSNSNRAEFEVTLPTINASLTTIYGRFFATAKIEKSAAGVSTSTDETDRSQFQESNLIALEESDVKVERHDISLTLGYNVLPTVNVFVGYLDGKTTLTPAPLCANPFDENIQCSRVNRAFQHNYLGLVSFNGQTLDQDPYQQDYTEKGFYLGANGTYVVGDVGKISLSIAYAIMDGTFKDNANDPFNAYVDENNQPTFVPFNFEGDTRGTSIAVTWVSALGDTAAYFIDLRRQYYSMKGKDASGFSNFTDLELQTDEEMLGLSLGVNFYF